MECWGVLPQTPSYLISVSLLNKALGLSAPSPELRFPLARKSNQKVRLRTTFLRISSESASLEPPTHCANRNAVDLELCVILNSICGLLCLNSKWYVRRQRRVRNLRKFCYFQWFSTGCVTILQGFYPNLVKVLIAMYDNTAMCGVDCILHNKNVSFGTTNQI